jgi:hypothetical protein
MGAVVVLAGAALLVPRFFGSASPSAGPLASATGSPAEPSSSPLSSAASAAATPSPSGPTDEPLPTADARGWPVTLPYDVLGYGGYQIVGPDGTLYMEGEVPIDRTGNARTGWLQLSDGTYGLPKFFGSDGSAYGGGPEGVAWSFSSDGKLRYNVPIDSEYEPQIELGPSGRLYLISYPPDSPDTKVTVLDSGGKVVVGWTIAGSTGNAVVRPDGSLLIEIVPDESCTLHAFDSAGHDQSATPGPCWEEMRLGPGGIVVGESYVRTDVGEVTELTGTRVAVLGADGRPAAGWPQEMGEIASPPAFGSDGTIYLTRTQGSGKSPQLVAFDAAGQVKTGFPVELAGSMLTGDLEAVIPVAPVPAAGGIVFVAGSLSVSAYASTGSAVEGWPYELPAAWADFQVELIADAPAWNPGPVYAGSGSSPGLLYLGLKDRVVALDATGKVASGWPYRPDGAGFLSWRELDPTPDGGLIVFTGFAGDDESHSQVLRLGADGKLAK